VARPKDGVQHPDLDRAWAEYEQSVAKTAEGITAAIAKKFDVAAAKGDLDAAEKWQAALEKFEKAGEVPTEAEVNAIVKAAVTDYKKAKEELYKAYELVVKALTRDKKIAEAKTARDELRSLGSDRRMSPPLGNDRQMPALPAFGILPKPKSLSQALHDQLPTADEIAVLRNHFNATTRQVQEARDAFVYRLYRKAPPAQWTIDDASFLISLRAAMGTMSGEPEWITKIESANLAKRWLISSPSPADFIERARALVPTMGDALSERLSTNDIKNWLISLGDAYQTSKAKSAALNQLIRAGVALPCISELKQQIDASLN
jgi:tetratricopeptide (TPR) repeat protein